jgi:hypothetical protein
MAMKIFSALVFVSLIPMSVAAQDPVGGPDPAQNQNVQVLTRGPVHEAFALPVVNDPKPGLTVAKQPPAPVEEAPPDQKPTGQNVQWISGYWSWDASRDDFLWVSGVWREPPPGRQWVPGYWNQVEGGYQWVAGAWVPLRQAASGPQAQTAPQTQSAYVPAPPASLETGPNSPAPSANVFWSPGSWYWQDTRYVWRPGFWAAVQPSWVWIPPHYVWTPAGTLFVEGYWDLPLASRGILFAPVYYAQPVYLQPAYVYTPAITIASSGLTANLFVQPGYNHYVFGDYYDRAFLSIGIFPWFSFTYTSGPRPVYYDPLFTFYASVNVGRNPGWATQVRERYIVRRDNVAMRPPRTFIEQTRIIERNVNVTNNIVIARPFHELGNHPESAGGVHLERVSAESRRQWQTRNADLAQFREQRALQERQAAGRRPARAGGGTALAENQSRARPLALPASPVAAPIHHHAAAGEPIGPRAHADHGTATDRTQAASAPGRRPGPDGFHHTDGPASASPMTHHLDQVRTPATGQSLHPGMEIPRSSGLSAESRSHLSSEHEMAARSEASRLHSPSQYTHRQPPPPPRPANRQEHKEGRRTP